MLDYLPKPQSRPERAVHTSDISTAKRERQPASRGRTPSKEALDRQQCVVEFRSGEAVIRHPDLKCFLDAGWLIESAVPQLAESEQVELRVILCKGGGPQSVSADDEDL